jgi:alpha-methylacyl-CoA racemase
MATADASRSQGRSGPLSGITVVELAGIGPGPFCGMMLADMGADVIRVDRAERVFGGDPAAPPTDVLARGRRSIGVDLKSPDGVETVLKLVEKADAIFEGFRPGVTERLGLGPDVCLARNPKLVYGRMTGWGQEGPYAQAAGHDINYIALAGALHPIGRRGEAPVPPLNLVGDFGGGGLVLAFGMVCALLEAKTSGKGQVVDTAMVDGAALLTAMFYGMRPFWTTERGTNLLDTGAHFYDVYETKDGEHVSIGSIEPQFYAELRRLAGLDADEWGAQMDRSQWPALKEKIAAVFKTPQHPHNVERGTFKTINGVVQPGPAPRYSRTPAEIQGPAAHPGQHTDDVLASFGFAASDIAKLREAGAVK